MKIASVGVRNIIKIMLLVAALAMGATAALAQRPGGGPPADVDMLAGLKHALEDAGAAALSTQQAEQLNNLIRAFRQAQQGQPPSDAIEQAHRALDAAILAGNQTAANTQIGIIANALSAGVTARGTALAKFQIDVLNVLKSNQAQYTALLQCFGTKGVPNLAASLVGGGPGQGGPGGPGGPGGFNAPGRPGGGPHGYMPARDTDN